MLDQAFVAGLGNIYVDEALHRARLHPERRSDTVGTAAAGRLRDEIRATLTEAIAREGSSFDAFYRTPEGQPGSYQHQFQVYGRDGRPCRRCGRAIVKIVADTSRLLTASVRRRPTDSTRHAATSSPTSLHAPTPIEMRKTVCAETQPSVSPPTHSLTMRGV